MLTEAIKKAKGDEEKKVGVSLKMPESFRNKLQNVADKNNVSLNALIIAMLETVFESQEDKKDNLTRYEELSKIVKECNELLENGVSVEEVGFDPIVKKSIAVKEMNEIKKLIEIEMEN